MEPNQSELRARDPAGPSDTEVKAWELIDNGRYRPRRIRGSLRGRELG
jgi:hypothetical protein